MKGPIESLGLSISGRVVGRGSGFFYTEVMTQVGDDFCFKGPPLVRVKPDRSPKVGDPFLDEDLADRQSSFVTYGYRSRPFGKNVGKDEY